MKKCYFLMFIVSFCISSFAQPNLQVESLHYDSIQVNAGWNLLSLPVSVIDGRKSSLFPTAASDAFIYENSYQPKDTLENGLGFWLKFNSTETIYITGETVIEDTIEVRTGWNMIGSLSIPIAVSMVKTEPPDIITSEFFGYNQSGVYQETDTIQSGKGYWVKVNENGKIILIADTTMTFGTPCPGTPTVSYAGKTYNTVQIGTQCWLKENLNVGTMIDGSQDPNDNSTIEKYCYSNDPSKCDTLGGLYQWNEAMQYSNTEGVRGICPSGWHIPTMVEFQTLSATVGGDGNALKAIGQGTGAGAGTNTSGFSALLGGYHSTMHRFGNLGYAAEFWSSTEFVPHSAYGVIPYGYDSVIYFYYHSRGNGFSVRCIKDLGEAPQVPEQSSPPNGAVSIPVPPTLIWKTTQGATSYTLQVSTDSLFSSFVYNQSGLTDTSQQIDGLNNSTKYYWYVSATNIYSTSNWSSKWSFTTSTPCPGTPTVPYEGKTYNTVQIGTQCWLKENLDIGTMLDSLQNQTDNSLVEKYCYRNDPSNCDTYGGLYQWNEAMQYSTTEGARGICPSGWHVPTYAEFQTLSTTVGGDGNALKAVAQESGGGTGTNTSGFSALHSGYRIIDGIFFNLGIITFFWSSTEYDTDLAYPMLLYYDDSIIYFYYEHKENGFSVRCVKDLGEAPQMPELSSPSNGSVSIPTPPTLIWKRSNGATSYTLQVSTDSMFSSYVYNQNGLTDTSQQIDGLSNSTKYYWHVNATNSYSTSNWSSKWSFTTSGGGSPCPGTPTVDYQGKTYNTVQIGNQCWLRENLDAGTMIAGDQSQNDNSTIEKYCYNNDTNNCNLYGGLYQWWEAMQYSTTEGARGLCPIGWHIPSFTEFQTCSTTVDGDGNALKSIGQGTGAGVGTNTSGFSALLTGHRDYYGGFIKLGTDAVFWSSSKYDYSRAYDMSLNSYASTISVNYGDGRELGYSVRCVKD